ncbi:hypothetical protein PsYK624_168140 [Phanerochaete sordida]|uniref:Uncharacterized protein n=1 Tax=Phanerochaete sordida TaxID=48140 RepID=A0A9P3GS63_9APHY|nr:hypothetical protein PsYK624_168140 [Phanerochaete sordida]
MRERSWYTYFDNSVHPIVLAPDYHLVPFTSIFYHSMVIQRPNHVFRGYLLNMRLCAKTRLRRHALGFWGAYRGLRARQWGATLERTGVKDEAPDSRVEKATATCRIPFSKPA